MSYIETEQGYVIRLTKGDTVVSRLQDFIKANNIKSAWLSGLGGLTWIELGFYDLDSQEYQWQKFDYLLELTSMVGNISWQGGEPVIHAHATVSDSSFHAYGGHLKEAEVAGTVEVLLTDLKTDSYILRKKDDQTGLNLLDI